MKRIENGLRFGRRHPPADKLREDLGCVDRIDYGLSLLGQQFGGAGLVL